MKLPDQNLLLSVNFPMVLRPLVKSHMKPVGVYFENVSFSHDFPEIEFLLLFRFSSVKNVSIEKFYVILVF